MNSATYWNFWKDENSTICIYSVQLWNWLFYFLISICVFWTADPEPVPYHTFISLICIYQLVSFPMRCRSVSRRRRGCPISLLNPDQKQCLQSNCYGCSLFSLSLSQTLQTNQRYFLGQSNWIFRCPMCTLGK